MDNDLYRTEDNKLVANFPYFQCPNSVFDADIKEHDLIVYIYLWRCANHGKTAFPSYQTIAKKCKISRATAMRAVKNLTDKGLIEKTKRHDPDKGLNHSNVYYLKLG